ncbi:MAG TPA: RecX family transcriptional regulator [Acetobacteraceae bacterium]
MRAPRPIPPPDEASLREAALAYLARYSATEAGLRRVLNRRVDRWARSLEGDEAAPTVEAARDVVRAVVARLVAAGVVDNAAFAEARTRSLVRAGRSRRAVAAHLAAKGVDAATARAVLPSDDATELAAAIALTARRRIGAFRAAAADDAARRRELGMMARAGFPQPIAVRALGMDRDAAEAILHRLRKG